MAVVKNLMVRAGADFSGLTKETKKAQNTLANFQKQTKNIMKGIGISLATLGIGKVVKDSVKSAMDYEASIMSINRIMGSSANEFKKWADSQSEAYGLARNEAMKYGSVYGNLVSGFSKTSKETMQNTESLIKASAIMASGTGRTMEDVMERVRSGMLGNTEAIEDLGVYVNVAMLKSTKAFQMFANGKSWDQLDYQTQQQIRMFAILEQANTKFGDSIMNNTNFAQMQLVAQLKNVQLSLGQAFLPIYNIILPALTSFVSSLARAIDIVAQFSQALFGTPKKQKATTTNVNKQAQAISDLGDSYGDAGKQASKAFASFDEINTLSSGASASGGIGGIGDAGGIGDIGSNVNMDTNATEVSAEIQAAADKIKKAIGEITKFFSDNKEVVVSCITGILGALGGFFIMTKWSSIVTGFLGALKPIVSIFSFLSSPIVLVAAAIGLVIGNIAYLWQTSESFRTSVIEVWNQIATFFTTVWNDCWNIVVGIWDKYGQTLINNISGFMESIQNIIISVWENILKPFIQKALDMFTWLWENHLKGLVEQVGEFVMKLVNGALELWNEFFAPLIEWLVEYLGPAFNTIWGNICDVVGIAFGVISDVVSGILKVLGGIIDFVVGVFTGDWEQAWQGVQDIFGGIWDALGGIVKGALNIVIKVINWAIEKINGALNFDVPDWDFLPDSIQGKSFGLTIPQIPYLAKGGIVDNPTLAMVGEAGREAVMPLENNTGWINELASKINNIGGNNPVNVTLKIGENEFGRAIINSLNNVSKQNGGVIPLII